MKKTLLVLSFFQMVFAYSQTEKTLLWEISGNGLEKKSYVYGTMHVTNKISYHLSDAFFEHLLNADIIANESHPETWKDLDKIMTETPSNYPYHFYTNFYLTPVKKEQLLELFNTYNHFFNNLLSGVNEMNADFSEDTILDTFIFQTGKKKNKQVVGLENVMESIAPLLNLNDEDVNPEPGKMVALIKLTKNKPPFEVLKNSYREKDIVLLDSINKLILSDKVYDALIVKRNETMAHSIDSISRKGSLFAAIGAGHLAGKTGVIQKLIDRGFTVTPVFDAFTEVGKQKQKELEQSFIKPQLTLQSTQDNILQMPLFNYVEHQYTRTSSPDYANGGIVMIHRLPLNYFFNQGAEEFQPETLDSLFYENIPGEILSKKYSEENGLKVYDIKNKSKIGNYQHYRFYITPLEVIGISMTGVGEYVQNFENLVFDAITFKNIRSEWALFSPQYGGFSVEMPHYHFVTNTESTAGGKLEIQAYDPSDKSYYFINRQTLNDYNTLENSAFELKQMHYEFLLQHKLDTLNTLYDAKQNTFVSESKLNDKKLQLKSIINGNEYYLMGCVNATDVNAQKFLQSFKTKPYTYTETFEILKDTAAHFTVNIPKESNKTLFYQINRKESYPDKNQFLSESAQRSFNSTSGKSVNMSYYKFPKYRFFENPDSLKVFLQHQYLNQYEPYDIPPSAFNRDVYYDSDYYDEDWDDLTGYDVTSKWYKKIYPDQEKWELKDEKFEYDKTLKMYIYEANATNEGSSQGIRYKTYIGGDSYHMLKTVYNHKQPQNDAFTDEVFKTFTPDANNSETIFKNKLPLFLEDVKSESDTIRYSAMNSIHVLHFSPEDFGTLTNFIDHFDFKDSEISAKETLIEALGYLKNKNVIPYLERLYKTPNAHSSLQFAVLKALIYQKSKMAYAKIMELMEYDLPISNNQFDIYRLFSSFNQDPNNSKSLYPKLFQFYNISEYKQQILTFFNNLLVSKEANIGKLNPYKKLILNDAKVHYKKLQNWNIENKARKDAEQDYENRYGSDYAPTKDLENLVNLLNFFKDDTSISAFFNKIQDLDIADISININELNIKNNQIVPAVITKSLQNPQTSFSTVLQLVKYGKDELVTLNDDEIAYNALYFLHDLKEKDSVTHLLTREVTKGSHTLSYYFYKVKKKQGRNQMEEEDLMAVSFITENGKINPDEYKFIPSETIIDEDELEEMYVKKINSTLNGQHNRANYSILKQDNNMYFDGIY